MKNQEWFHLSIYLFFTILFFSCSTISKFDQYAYTQATSIKVDALNLMSLATDDYNLHTEEVKKVQTQIEKIYEYEKKTDLKIL
jgi:hypothetical protein